MSTTPEALPDEAARAPDAVFNDAPADVDDAVDDREIPEDDNADLYSEGEVSSKAESAIVVAEEDESNEVNDATDEADADGVDESDRASASSALDAGSDGNADDVRAADGVDEGKAEVQEDSPALPPPSTDEAAPDAESAEVTVQAAKDEPQPHADQGSVATAADEPSASDVPADASSPPASAAAASETAPAPPSNDADDVEDVEGAHDADLPAADVDDAAEDSTASTPAAASTPSPLPYIDDIAMLDTGEPGEIQPNAPTESSFTSSIQAQATSATSVDADEMARSTANDKGPGIDFDKMIDAISADAAKPPVAVSQAPIGAPKGPSNPFSRPPTGPAHMSRRYANNSTLPNAPAAGPPGTMGGAVPLGSPPLFPAAAGGRRGQATRVAQGQPPTAPRQANNTRDKAAVDRAYQAFLNEEKIHVAEGKWEAFPEGSRMFVGNLSQERVSKRDVFEQFHRYGRLAQIAIKSAYGFVQYHSVAEASAAMRELEGTEIRGRKIHLEISKVQKKEKDRERESEQGGRERDRARGGKDRSPERRTRGGRDREGDRYDGRSQGNGRRPKDDHYAGSHDGHGMSPRQDRDQNDSYGRNRGGHDDYSRRSRDRSRSPNRHGSHGDGNKGYRSRRSPSPYGRGRNDSGRGSLDALKTRYGGDVPDVQFLVAQGLDRDFIKWAQAPFIERGLRTDVILLTPHTPPRDSIIQVHVLEGVFAVVDLDRKAQANGKIPVQVFNRSAGVSNVRFDGYQDLAPSVAADVVLRAKSAAVAQQPQQYPPHQPPYSQGHQGPPSYGQQYAHPQAAGYSSAPPAAAVVPSNGIDLASLVGQLDNATLAQLLGAMQAPQAAPAAVPPPASYGQPPPAAQYATPANAAQQAQLAALLSTLGAGAAPAPSAPHAYGSTSAPYAAGVPAVYPAAAAYQPAAPQGADEQSIQAIMAYFAKSRQ